MSNTEARQVWVIGFPKSGNTWMSYLISYCLNIPFHNFGNPSEKPQKAWVSELTSGKNSWAQFDGFDSVQKTHKYPRQVPFHDGLVIYALRDPRDVFVSYHYFMSSSNARMMGRLRYYLLGVLGKQAQIKWFLAQWEKHLEAWLPHSEVVISYDKLLADGPEYLAILLGKDPFDLDKGLVSQAYDQFSFENMSGGRKAGSEDQKSFFRKGVSGDWENHFSEEEATLFSGAIKVYENAIRP